MDQLSAHLDRGWDLAQKGDAPGASACARRALELDPSAPEVHNLLGFVAALEGDAEQAVEHYRHAITLDETYLEAMLNAAEILIYPLGEFQAAIEHCNDALDLSETKEEALDCVLLKVDALMALGETEEATRTMAMIPEGPFEGKHYVFLIGRAYFELGLVEKAAPLIEQAAQHDPDHSDSQYYLGLVRDERGDQRGATEAFLRVRALDQLLDTPSWTPSPEGFGAIVRAVVERLDAVLSRYVREAEVYVADVPGIELVVDGVDPRSLLVLDPPHENDKGRASVRIFVYQRNLERASGSVESMEEVLGHALEREITSVFLEGKTPDKSELN